MPTSVPTETSAAFHLSNFSPEFTLSEWEKVKHALSGPLRYGLTNDLMFKLFLQDNPYALKGFIGAIYCIDPDTIESVIVKNPFLLGNIVDDKVAILDLRLLLNSKEIVDIEMQVSSQIFFPERSLIYLCRSFDQLKRGESYDQILPCVQVSILCNDMFARDDPRYTDAFFSEYALLEKKTLKEYSDKFKLLVVSLKHIENAIDKENPNGLYKWAKLFAATTWEDIKMIVENNNYMKSAGVTLQELTADEQVKLAVEARLRNESDLNSNYSAGMKKAQAELLPIIEATKAALEAKDATLEAKDAEITRLKAMLKQKNN